MRSSRSQRTDGKSDGRTTCRGITAFCVSFLEQQLIWSHSATHLVLVLVGATSSYSSVVSNRIGVTFDILVLQVNMDQITVWDFRFNVTLSRWQPFYATKCCHLVSEHEAFLGVYAAASVSSWFIAHSYSRVFLDISLNYKLDFFHNYLWLWWTTKQIKPVCIAHTPLLLWY